jgi:hypothetical protein
MSVDVVGSQQNPLGFLQMPVHYALKIELGTEEDNQSSKDYRPERWRKKVGLWQLMLTDGRVAQGLVMRDSPMD